MNCTLTFPRCRASKEFANLSAEYIWLCQICGGEKFRAEIWVDFSPFPKPESVFVDVWAAVYAVCRTPFTMSLRKSKL